MKILGNSGNWVKINIFGKIYIYSRNKSLQSQEEFLGLVRNFKSHVQKNGMRGSSEIAGSFANLKSLTLYKGY